MIFDIIYWSIKDKFIDNTFQHEGAKTWFKEKRIVSTDYFKRYFSYSVIEGELSDVIFEDFINSIKTLDTKNIIDKLDLIFKNPMLILLFLN